LPLRCLLLPLLLTLPAAAQIVDGTVADAVTGKPIPGARIKLKPSDRSGADPLYTKTDAEGRFRFLQPPVGSYQVTPDAIGYLAPPCCALVSLNGHPSRATFASPGQPFPKITEARDPDGTSHASVEFLLTAYAVITGVITDPNGVPLPGAEIEIQQKVPAKAARSYPSHPLPGGEFILAQRSMTRADDRGQFRVAHLEPGAYYVVANRPQGIPGNWEPSYRPTYYPAATDPDAAKALNLAAGATVAADIRILRQTGARVSGRLIQPPIQGTAMTLVTLLPERNYLVNADRPFTNTSTGQFELAAVPPGRYILAATTIIPSVSPWDSKSVFGATQVIEVADHDLILDIPLRRLNEVTGTVKFAEGCKSTPVRLHATTQTGRLPDEVTPNAEGAFSLGTLGAGRTILYVQGVGIPASVRIGNREVKEGFDIPLADDEKLEVTISCPQARRPQ